MPLQFDSLRSDSEKGEPASPAPSWVRLLSEEKAETWSKGVLCLVFRANLLPICGRSRYCGPSEILTIRCEGNGTTK
ncbi:Hypothetical predicted protein [Pelobates cultripes]|uniref:Uncharacterized protein n=1 Tax=Pelobates cultripes TaxID=61616 RepID=A0AAD1WHB6_PELCU|nr:Hypothetical predicted protein [Pelobates cultripes]